MPKLDNPHNAGQLDRLLDSHGDRLFATLARLTLRKDAATELLGELFLRLAASIGFSQAEDPAAYAFRTAINLAMEWRRGRKRDAGRASLDAAGEIVCAQPSPLVRLVQSEQYEQLLDAISELNESAQRLFVWRFIEQQSYTQIAGELKTTPHRARGLCHAAVQQLRQKVGQLEVPPGATRNQTNLVKHHA
jgi:RNA polymerase sigma factor (sigma-70 family)